MSNEVGNLVRRRWRVAITLGVIMVLVYFGFILLVAFDKPYMGEVIAPGLSRGIACGAGVIVVTWCVTWYYVHWANRHVDSVVDAARKGAR